MVEFPYVVRIGNQYLKIVCVFSANLILAAPFKTKTKRQLTKTFLKIKKELDKKCIVINMHVLDNEASDLCKDAIEKSK